MNAINKGRPKNSLNTEKGRMYVLMTFLVFSWGLEYAFAKHALEEIAPLTLLFFKYIIAFGFLLALKLKLEGKKFIRKEDLPVYILCALCGDLGYFYCEYKAMYYLPVSIITIVLALVPLLSIFIERLFYRQKVSAKLLLGIMVSIIGIIMIIGVDMNHFPKGKWLGYVLAFGAVIFWNGYNFLTVSLHHKYDTMTLTLNQVICALLMVWPFAFSNLPEWSKLTPSIVGGVLYLAIVSTTIGFAIMVRALKVLGPTVAAVFSNFLPVTSTFFGWLLLKETIMPVQMLGGIIVVAAGYFVIKEKGRIQEELINPERADAAATAGEDK